MAKHHQISIVAVFFFFAAAACFLPSHVGAAREVPKSVKFIVQGRVFCDTCRAGFETPASKYIAGAKVKVECRDKTRGAKTCSFEGVTDNTGSYNILVNDEHEHELCEAMLVSSPHSECATLVPGREKSRVYLTNNNGMASNKRFANAMGFQKNTPLPECAQLLKIYVEEDE